MRPTPAWIAALMVLVGVLIVAVAGHDSPRPATPSIVLHSVLLDADLPGATPTTAAQLVRLRQKAQALGAACAEPVESLQAEWVGPLLGQVRQIVRRQGDVVEEYRDVQALTAFGIRRAGPLLVVATGSLVLICRTEAGRAA